MFLSGCTEQPIPAGAIANFVNDFVVPQNEEAAIQSLPVEVVTAAPVPEVVPIAPIENDMDFVEKWGNADVSKWPVTSELKLTMVGRSIRFDHTKANVWPCWLSPNKNQLNGNTWVIYLKDGMWKAETWEWAGKGIFSKPKDKADRPDLGRDLKPGDRVGFLVSGLIRGPQRNVSERSNVVWVEW
jgi:hypothetical protein